MRYFKSRLKGSAVGTIVGSAAAAIGVPIFCLIKWFTSGENLLGLGILFFIGGAIGVVVCPLPHDRRTRFGRPAVRRTAFFQGRFQQFEIVKQPVGKTGCFCLF